MAGAGFKKGVSGMAANIDSGPGSKSGAGQSQKEGVTKEKSEKDVKFADGGDTPMFGPQNASEQKPGGTAHDTTEGGAVGGQFASGGKGKMFGFTGSLPATAGITSAR